VTLRARLGLATVVAALGALALVPAAALAHASLEGTSPARGADLKTAPRAVTFRFDEPVEGNFGAVRVFDATGRRVDDNTVVHPGGRGPEVGVGLNPGLPDGTYTATYRVISADSHPVSGGVVFSIGNPGGPAATVSDLLSGSSTGLATEIGFGVARGLDYLAIALLLGGLAFLLLSWRPALVSAAGAGGGWPEASAAFAARARRMLTVAVVLGVVSGAAGIVLQGATAGGTSFWSALDPSVVREVLGTRFGRIWGLRLFDWLVLGTVLAAGAGARTIPVLRPAAVGADGVAPAPFPGAGVLAALAIPAAFLAITPALAGHATTQSPVVALFPLDVVHVLAMSVWTGGLVALLFVVPAATRRLEPPERTRLLAALLLRFSPLALACVVALAVTGVLQALIDMGWSLSALTDTPFGRAVLIKVALLIALVGLGAVNRQRVVPGLRRLADGGEPPGAAGRLLRRTLRGEVALVVIVLGVTSALVSYAPPVSAASGPVSRTTRMGPIELQTTVDPARVGANQMHVYLFDAKSGAAYTRTKELTVQAALPAKHIGALKVTMHQAGPGHYVADAFSLVPKGDWQLTVTDRVSDFDEYTGKVEVPVR
jgi:copper transport protein